MRFTLQLVLLLGLSFGLFMEANAGCRRKGGCCKRCPDGWIRYAHRCYKFVNEEKSWCDAETACVQAGGNLASIHSQEDLDHVRGIVKEATGTPVETWLGGYDQVQDGCWKNSDGSSFISSFWGPGEPNNWGGPAGEGCMELDYKPSNAVPERQPLNDSPCTASRPYICAVELEEEEEDK